MSDSDHSDVESVVGTYLKSIALLQIHKARLELLPPAWSQKQQCKEGTNKTRKYSKVQTQVLHSYYKQKPYVNREEMALLAQKTGLSMLQVKIWYQNRRLKDRKAGLKH